MLISELTQSSASHESDTLAKKTLLARAHQISSELWKISTTRSTITATCRDENVVTEQVQSQHADFDPAKADAFQGLLRKICEINISSAADSYISETATEVALSRLIHHYDLSNNILALKSAFGRLTKALGVSSTRLSTQTLDVLRGLVYFVGLAILKKDTNNSISDSAYKSNNTGQKILDSGSGLGDALVDFDGSQSYTSSHINNTSNISSRIGGRGAAVDAFDLNSSLGSALPQMSDSSPSSSIHTSSHREEPLSIFLLMGLVEAQGLQWGSTLLLPSLDDVMLHNWLSIAFEANNLGKLSEAELIKVAAQVPWAHFAFLNPSVSNVSADLLNEPIAASNNFSTPVSSSVPNLPEGAVLSHLPQTQRPRPSITSTSPNFLGIVKRSILMPLQAAIHSAANRNFVAAIVFFSKILAVVSRSLPSQLTATCIGILMRAPWPAKMVTIPSLQLFDWNALDAQTLVLLFGELYHLFQRKPAEYFHSASREDKVEHRNSFANFVVSNQPMMGVTYQLDANLYRLNFQRAYPIFFIFAQIALTYLRHQLNSQNRANSLLRASGDGLNTSSDVDLFDLPRLVVEELFHFAAAWEPNLSSPNYAFQCSSLALLRAEVHDALNRVCQEAPRLYQHVMVELLHDLQVPKFNVPNGLHQLQPQLMAIDFVFFNSLAFLLTRRSLANLPPENSPTYRSALSAMADDIMADHTVRYTDHLAWPVATGIFSRLLWHTAPPILRAYAILLIVSLSKVKGAPSPAHALDWINEMLARLLSPSVLNDLTPLATDLLLEHLSNCPVDYAAAQAARIAVALSAVRNAISSSPTSHLMTTSQLSSIAPGINASSIPSASSRFTFSWLWDSFKLKTAMDQLIIALRRLPTQTLPTNTQENYPPQQHTTRSAHLTTSSGNSRTNQPGAYASTNPFDALNSVASAATNAIFGLNQHANSSVRVMSTNTSTQNLQTTSPTSTNQQSAKYQSAILLLQRVTYHYAHCIKHSPGQGQREVSIVFNQLIEQLELFRKGSGMVLLEELFNESMGPRAGASVSNDPKEIESRQLFLNFWVFALVPRLSQWNTSISLTRVLDAFAYTAFFSQARFGEMVSLLPQNSPQQPHRSAVASQTTSHHHPAPSQQATNTSPLGVWELKEVDINTLLSKGHVWLVYFLIWAYTPKHDAYNLDAVDMANPTPSERFRTSQLWKWFEAASSPHVSPAVALIFWERFFWSYFEVASQRASTNFIPERWQNMIHTVLLRSGYALAHPYESSKKHAQLAQIIRSDDLIPENGGIAMNHVYARLTTWNKGNIFTSGAYLFQPLLLPPDAPEAGLLAELHNVAQVPSLFAVAYDPSRDDLVAQKPFPKLPDPETPDIVASLIPFPRVDTSSIFVNESNLNLAYLFELDRNRKALERAVLNGNGSMLVRTTSPTSNQNDLITMDSGDTNTAYNMESEFNPRGAGAVSSYENLSVASDVRIPALDDIEVWSAQLVSLEGDLRSCDSREVTAVRTLWKTLEKQVPLVLSCGEGCSGPHRVTVKTTIVAPGEGQSDAIQRARSEYEQVRMQQLSAQRNLASAVVLLEDLARCTLDATEFEESHKQALLAHLFFAILPNLLSSGLRGNSPLYARLMTCALLTGREAIQNKPNRDHMRFFKMILEDSKNVKNTFGSPGSASTSFDSYGTKSSSRNQTSSKSTNLSSSSHLHTSQGQSGGNQISSSSSTAALQAAVALRTELFELFTPICFISGNDYSVYVELLYILVKTPLTENGLSSQEQIVLASQFNLAQTIDHLVENYLARLFDILELAAVRPPLVELVKLGISAILRRYASELNSEGDFSSRSHPSESLLDDLQLIPSHQSNISQSTSSKQVIGREERQKLVGRIVRLVLLACPHSPMLGSWDLMQDSWLGPYLLPFVESALPSSHAAVIGSSIALVARITSLASFDVRTHFELLAKFFKALFSNATAQPLLSSAPNRAAFIAGYELIISRCPPDLIWQLYLNILTPFFAHNSGADLTRPLDILCSAPWRSLELPFSDQNFVVQLAALPLFHMPLVRSIFQSIDWHRYARETRSYYAKEANGETAKIEENKIIDLLGSDTYIAAPKDNVQRAMVAPKMIHFLALFCRMNLLAPAYIDADLKKLVMSISKQGVVWYIEGRHLFDWREARAEDFASAFRGDTLVSSLRAISVSPRNSDPSSDFLDNLQLLNDVARHAGSVEAIEVCLEEIKSALFFVAPSCAPMASNRSMWHLPIHANIECVSQYMIPLTQQYHQMQAEKCTLPMSENGAPRMIYHQSSYDALVSLLSVAGRGLNDPLPPRRTSLENSNGRSSPHDLLSTSSASSSGDSLFSSPNHMMTTTSYHSSSSQAHARMEENSTSYYGSVYRMIESPVPFMTTAGDAQSIATFKEEAKKAVEVIRGLIVRFMGTLDNDLCLAVLHVAARAFPLPGQHSLLVSLWEEALRSYFVQAKFSEQLMYAVNAFTLPGGHNDSEEILRSCATKGCPLAMRMVLEREKHEWVNFPKMQYTEAFTKDSIHYVASCVAPKHREFDLIVLWFFVLDCVSHPKFVASHKQSILKVAELIQYFNRNTGENEGFLINALHKFNDYLSDSVHKEMMKLAMKAVRLFLQRELTAKEPLASTYVKEGVLPRELDHQLQLIAKLYPGKKGSEMQRYPTFFQEVLPSLLSPLLDVASFEMRLVRSLVPIAPYLQCFIEGHENWTEDGL